MTRARPAGMALVAALAAACAGSEGTIALTVVTAPGSEIMEQIETARLTLSDPYAVVEVQREPGHGLALALDVPAGGGAGHVTFEGHGAGGALVAYGRTALLPLSAVDAAVAIYVAPPLSVAEAPVALDPPRADMAVAPLPYGALVAGGRLEDGQLAGDLAIYNVYRHEFQRGLDLPERRAGMTAVAGASGFVYLFGGVDADGVASAAAWRFDTGQAPAGAYAALTTDPALARARAAAAPRPQETFVVTGDPLVRIDGLDGRVSAYAGAPAMAGSATTAVVDGIVYTLFAGAGSGARGLVLLTADAFRELEVAEAERTGHAAVALPDGTLLVVGGATEDGLPASALRVDPRASTAELVPGFLATPRRDAAVASTDAHLVVAGGAGADDSLVHDVEIFDVVTLSRVVTQPLGVPRRGATAVALSNGQVLIMGGQDAEGVAVARMELFTPAP